MNDLREILAAREPVVIVHTHEEKRGILAARESLIDFLTNPERDFRVWTVASGVNGNGTSLRPAGDKGVLSAIAEEAGLAGGTDAAKRKQRVQVWVLLDYHSYLKDPGVRRELKNLRTGLIETRTSVVLLGPPAEIPDGLDEVMPVLRLPLPGREDMAALLHTDALGSALPELTDAPKEREKVVDALMGLTRHRAELALRRSVAVHDKANVDALLAYKAADIQTGGVLELLTDERRRLSDVGGYTALVEFLRRRRAAFTPEGQAFIGTYPRGVTLAGPPGTGKSLVAKAIAGEWGLPLARLDMGKVFGSLVGQSEERMRSALERVDRIAPAVLWCDEAEKGLSGTGGDGDSGVSKRVLGTLLTWLQERKSPVFMVFTVNSVLNLPPELLRKGRVDELFWLDLPDKTDRQSVFNIHLSRRRGQCSGVGPIADYDLAALADASDGFSGAEIEQAIVSALYAAFDDGQRAVTQTHLLREITATMPLSRTAADSISAMREWAKVHARSASETSNSITLGDRASTLDLSATPVGMAMDVLSLPKKARH